MHFQNIFKMAEFEAQNTLLGKYYYKGKEKIVCACEDFTDNEHILYEFENLALSTNLDRKIETELTDIMDVLEESKMIDTKEKLKHCLAVEKNIYFPGGGKTFVWNP